jgi:hypothetical protein
LSLFRVSQNPASPGGYFYPGTESVTTERSLNILFEIWLLFFKIFLDAIFCVSSFNIFSLSYSLIGVLGFV